MPEFEMRKKSKGRPGNRGYRLVEIEWRDSCGCSSNWQEIEDCKPAVMSCRSVGWLVYDGSDSKVIVPHLTEDGDQGCGDMTIPAKAIVRIRKIKVV
jgi:hypothetical protein